MINSTLIDISIIIIVTFLSTIILIPKIIHFAELNSVMQKPNYRSSHNLPTASIGGLIFIPILIIGTLSFAGLNKISVACLSALVIALVGYLDDKYNLNFKEEILVNIMTNIMII